MKCEQRCVIYRWNFFLQPIYALTHPLFPPSVQPISISIFISVSVSVCISISLILLLLLFLLVTHIHTSHVFLSTPLLHSLLLTDPFAYDPARLPPANDSPGPQVYMIKFPEKRIWLPEPEIGFHPWIMWLGVQGHMGSSCSLYAKGNADSLRKGTRHGEMMGI